MRLIDADLLQEVLAKEPMKNRTYLRANEIVVDMPTAYYADKVVEQMEEYVKESSNVDYNRAMIEAIEIVKSGGIAEEKKAEWKEHFASRCWTVN